MKNKRLFSILVGIIVVLFVILPITCLLAILASYHIYQEKDKKSIKKEMEYISEIVESNQNLLEEFCIYELSQKKSVEDDKEIEKNGEYQNARDIIFEV